jgi:hypothetical protein
MSQPQVFTTTLTPHTERTPGRSTYAEYYETSMVNNTMMSNPPAPQPQLDISNMSGYKSTSIVTPSLTGGNIKVNINHEIFQKDLSSGNNSFYSAAVNPAIERSISIGFQQSNRENMRMDNLNMTPPKVTITRHEHSPFKSRVSVSKLL